MLLSFDKVSKDYGNGAVGLKSVSLQLEKGEFAALAGPSGSGKTTLLNLAAGLDAPTSGIVRLLGKPLHRLSAEQAAVLRRSSLGFVFQAYNLFPVLTVLENVEYPLALNHVDYAARTKASLEALEAVGMREYGSRFPAQLSGGQQQRVAVARAIVTKPKLVFADEPTANLDSMTASRLLVLFRQLNQERGITFLFSSHDARVLQIAKRVIEVHDGTIKKETANAVSQKPPRLPTSTPPRRRASVCERIL